MRSIALGALVALAACASGAGAGFAQTYPWCAVYTDGDRNCGFESLEQCRLTATPGAGGRCEQNLLYKPPAAEPTAAAPPPSPAPPPARKRAAKPQ